MTMIATPHATHSDATRCPRCTGRLSVERDHHGAYLSCFTCGYTREALDGSAQLDDDDVATPLSAGDDSRVRQTTGWTRVGPTAAAAAAQRPYLAPPARRCHRCSMRAWVWYVLGPAQGAWRCSYCGGDRSQ